jgi:outer membrane protein OmpA-like peptidoglycan-associated protein
MHYHRFVPVAFSAVLLSSATGCASRVGGPSPDLRLRRIVLYQSGIGYFEREGLLEEGRLRMNFRDREVDDVLKSLVVVEEGLDASREKPSTVSVRLEDRAKSADDSSISTLDLVLSRPVDRQMSIAYEVPTAIWKATYRVILPGTAAAPAARGAPDHAGMALVQAWALIDNASDEDWNSVELSLATGAPLSFSTDLRTTQFVERPTVSMAPPQLANGAVVAEASRSVNGDRDGDGIMDSNDKCPDEPESNNGFEDEDGCPDKGSVRLEGNTVRVLQQVHFDRGSDAVLAASGPILDEVAKVLQSNPGLAIEIDGHASNDEKDPWVVAARRAGAVRSALESRGAVAAKLSVQSFGDTRPLSEAATEQARQQNRRVEFHIVEESRSGEQVTDGRYRLDLEKGVAQSGGAGATPRELAGAVRYDIADPVTIAAHSSNLVTIVNRYVPGEDLLLFRPDSSVPSSATHPFRAARLDNRGGLELQAGSVSIFSGGTFVGEGILGHLNPGETTLVPYAVDGATEVHSSVDEKQKPLRIVAISRGMLTVEDIDTVTTRYEASVGDQPPGRLVIHHARRAGHDAKDLPPGTESTLAAYNLPLPVRAGQKSVLSVDETRTVRREVSVADTAGATLGMYMQGSTLPPDLDKRVRDVIALRGEIDQRDQEIASLREALTDAGARAGELRESLRAVEHTPRAGTFQKSLMDRLAEATHDIEDQSAKLAEKTSAQSLARSKLSENLRDLRMTETR